MLAMLNHSWGTKINNKMIKVNIEIVIVKEFDNTMFSCLNITCVFNQVSVFFSKTKTLPCKLVFSKAGFNLYSGLSKKTCFIIPK